MENASITGAAIDFLAPATIPDASPGDRSQPITPPFDPSVDGQPASRDPETGRFAPGNRLGRGSPLAARGAKLRAALFRSVDRGDMERIIKALVSKAANGDIAAAKLILQYTLGEPQPLDILESLDQLQAIVLHRVRQ